MGTTGMSNRRAHLVTVYTQCTTKYNIEDNAALCLQVALYHLPMHSYIDLQCRGSAGNQYPGRMTPGGGSEEGEDLN